MNPLLEFFQAAVPASAPKAARVLGSSFSPSSWRLHAQADSEFSAELQKAKRHKKPAPAWASVSTVEVPGVAASELAKFKDTVVDGLRRHLHLAEVRACAGASAAPTALEKETTQSLDSPGQRNESVVATLPADPPCHAGVEACTIGAEDPRSLLHGQVSLHVLNPRALCPLVRSPIAWPAAAGPSREHLSGQVDDSGRCCAAQ